MESFLRPQNEVARDNLNPHPNNPRRGLDAAPGYDHVDLEEVALSRTGKLWSYTTNHYKPPDPYVSSDPFEPYTVTAVELTEERMVVMGQLAPGIDPEALEVGMEMELVLGTLYEDDENEYVVWKWQPVAA